MTAKFRLPIFQASLLDALFTSREHTGRHTAVKSGRRSRAAGKTISQ
jgi:hypothetical protein